MTTTSAQRRRIFRLAAVCCVVLLLVDPSAEASRKLPGSLETTLNQVPPPSGYLDRADAPKRSLSLFSVVDFDAFAYDLLYVYDDHPRPGKSIFCIYDGPVGISADRRTNGLDHQHVYQGLWTDPVTGISYARNRWYDARTASWLSEDAYGDIDSPNLYAFVGWGPHRARDPMGLRELDDLDVQRLAFAGGIKALVRMERDETGTFTGAYLPAAVRSALKQGIGLTGTDSLEPEHYDHVLALIDIETASYRQAVNDADDGQPVVPSHAFFQVPMRYKGEWITATKWRPGVTDEERERNYKRGQIIMLVTEELPMMLAGKLRQPGQLVVEARPARIGRQAPPANMGVAKPHGGTMHAARMQAIVKKLRQLGWQDIRVNQQQADASGRVAGGNRPDISGINPQTGRRHNIEIDTNPAASTRHRGVVESRDPNAVNTFIIIDATTGRAISGVTLK